jgi:hypothetical protein
MSHKTRRLIDRQQTPNTPEDEARNRAEESKRASLVERSGRAMVDGLAELSGNDLGAWDRLSMESREQIWGLVRKVLASVREPSAAMWSGLARDLIMWNRLGQPTGALLYANLTMLGREVPQWLRDEIPDVDHVPPKGTVAVCVFKAMIDTALSEKQE